jgi:hypothetical protein
MLTFEYVVAVNPKLHWCDISSYAEMVYQCRAAVHPPISVEETTVRVLALRDPSNAAILKKIRPDGAPVANDRAREDRLQQ